MCVKRKLTLSFQTQSVKKTAPPTVSNADAPPIQLSESKEYRADSFQKPTREEKAAAEEEEEEKDEEEKEQGDGKEPSSPASHKFKFTAAAARNYCAAILVCFAREKIPRPAFE